MTVITENIKAQNPFRNRLTALQVFPQLMFPYILLNSFGRNSIAEAIDGNRLPGVLFLYFISMFLLSAMVTATQLELLTKPFSSCLPNQGKAQKNITLLSGTAAALFYGIVLFINPHPKGLTGILYFISNLSIGVSLFILGSFATFNIQRNKEKGTWFYIICVMILGAGLFLGCMDIVPFYIRLDSFLYYFSAPLLALTIFASKALYRYMTNHDFIRELALKNFTLPIPGNTVSTMEQADRFIMDRLSDTAEEESRLDRLFTCFIKKYSHPGNFKSVAAKLYCILDRCHTLNKSLTNPAFFIKLLILSFFPFLTGYRFEVIDVDISAVTVANFITTMLNMAILLAVMSIFGAFISEMFRPFNHNQMFPEGRNQRFYSSIIPWLMKQAAIASWIILVVFLSQLFKDIMPVIDFRSLEFHYNSLNFSVVLWTLIIVPVIDLFMIYFEKPCNAIIMIIYIISLALLSFYSMLTANTVTGHLVLILAVLISNGFFIERLARHTLKKDINFFI